MIPCAIRAAGPFVALVFLFLTSCAAEPQPVELGWTPDAPAVYRVSVDSGSRFSGPVSNLSSETRLVATLGVTPLSESEAEVEILGLGASTTDAQGEAVGLSLPDTTGETATVRFSSPGVVEGVEGGDSLLSTEVSLVSMEDVVRSVFPPLPEGSFLPADTWTGGLPAPFPNLGEDFVRMRYVVDSAGAEPEVTGRELSVAPRPFATQTAADEVRGEGHLDVEFQGTLDRRGGYGSSRRNATFESDFLQLGSGGYANGGLRLTQNLEVEKLSEFEQFGLDAVRPG
ncbi:hypothetical protein [Rubrobacter indicoceani]|uniref:hypothetical protein n=1 Tax=Rubrobacter indicoceani TaxID=2051957 RepID=UPI000E5AA0CA|nr:hypothetical protein [Rubrobacter indicoceani]